MVRFVLLLVCLLAFSGCASDRVWVNNSKTNKEAQKDFRECKYDSEKNSFVPYGDGRSPISAGLQEGFQSVNLMAECMRSRGYSLVDRNKHTDAVLFQKNLQDEISAALDAEDYNKILMIADPKLKDVPMNGDIYALRCRAYRELGNYKEAMESCNYAVKIDENNINVLSEKAITLAILGEPEIGIELLNVAITKNLMSSLLYNNRAYILNLMSKYDKAIEDCNKSLALDSSSPAPYKNRGFSYIGIKDYDNAVKSFNRALALNDKYSKAYSGRGEAYLLMNLHDKAYDDFNKACTMNDKRACEKVAKRNVK